MVQVYWRLGVANATSKGDTPPSSLLDPKKVQLC
jgi:hypothetical protein